MGKIRILFITGTRADYGKLKPIIRLCDSEAEFETHIYVTGMHLLPEYGLTVNNIKNDNYKNIHIAKDYKNSDRMDENLANTIISFSRFVRMLCPDLIVVHGDRTEPLAGAIVGALNNIKVAHIEGGEVSGTADEFMRHAITKLSHMHFCANGEAKFRLIQLGERERDIYVIGSPDIDIMLSGELPDIGNVKVQHSIPFDNYAIFIYHPVTTSTEIELKTKQVLDALLESNCNYVVIEPNNDSGGDIILRRLQGLVGNPRIRLFNSVPFEEFLTLLKNSDFIIGNSSAGIREACVYGVPAIDIGSRQNKRYSPNALRNILHADENTQNILRCISLVGQHRVSSEYWGNGHSAEQFVSAVKEMFTAKSDIQKEFIDLGVTSQAIANYINEVCF